MADSTFPGLLDSDRIATLEHKLGVAIEAIADLRDRLKAAERRLDLADLRRRPIGSKRR